MLNPDLAWSELLYYDESSPSRLRWNINLKRGRHSGYIYKEKDSVAGTYDAEQGYWEVSYRYKSYKAHRLIWTILKGNIPDNSDIDHINGDRGDNRIDNLRVVNRTINTRNSNKKSNNKSGVTGVSLKEQKGNFGWVAHWVKNGKTRSKYFSCHKYGDEVAFSKAVEYRDSMIRELNLEDAGYTSRHGT